MNNIDFRLAAVIHVVLSTERRQYVNQFYYNILVGCVAQLVERRSLTGELSLSCARPAADG